jgi:hypothetical protein
MAPSYPENMTAIAQFPGQWQRISTPTTADELAALIARRDEQNSQLETLSDQRNDIAHQLERLGSDPVVRSGPTARLKMLDDRIAEINRDVQAADEAIVTAKAKGLGTEGQTVVTVTPPPTPDFPPFVWSSEQQAPWRERMLNSLETSGPIALATVVLLGVVMYWWISRSVRGQMTKLVAMQSAKLEELQRSVDSVAVEVERVSENQRFVTKLVGDKAPLERR